MRSAFDMVSAWASVLATTKSTPWSPAVIMLLTALPPAPPTPNTVMRGFISRMSGIFKLIVMRLPLYFTGSRTAFTRDCTRTHAAEHDRSATGRWLELVIKVRSFRAAIVRPLPCNRPFLSSVAAYAAVRSVQDVLPAGRPAGPPPPRRPVLWPHRGARQCRAADRYVPDASGCATQDPRCRRVGSRRR